MIDWNVACRKFFINQKYFSKSSENPTAASTVKILAGGKILDNGKKSVWEILIKFSQMNSAESGF